MDRLVLDFCLLGSETFGGSTKVIGSEELEVLRLGVWLKTGFGGGGTHVIVLDW